MNFREAESFLFSLNNITHEAPGPVKQARLRHFLTLLGSPEKTISHYIHITGTSGKGSVAMMFASVLKADGHKTGLLLSPHHSTILERWQINGKHMSEKMFIRIIEIFQPVLQTYLETSPYPMLSPLELMTAIGLYYFAQEKVRYAVVEVNCGGRNDATNILPTKSLAIITHIEKDHLDSIGPTKADVAFEKSGIILRGTPTVTSEKNNAIFAIIAQEAHKQRAPLTRLIVRHRPPVTVIKNCLRFTHNKQAYQLKTIGEHQVDNALLVIEGTKLLGISEKAIASGLADCDLPIRLEVVSSKPLIILDGAHNSDKMKTTIAGLKRFKPNAAIHLVVGFGAHKDARSLVKLLTTLPLASVAVTRFSNPGIYRKAMNPSVLTRLFARYTKAPIACFLDPQAALTASKQHYKNGDLLLVTGSMFLSGELRPLF